MPVATITDIAANIFANEILANHPCVQYNPPVLTSPVGIGTFYAISAQDEKNNVVDKKVENFITIYKREFPESFLFTEMNSAVLENKLHKTLTILYTLRPDAVAMEMTSDDSVLYTLKVGDVKAYLEYYPENAGMGVDEYILNTYCNGVEDIDNFSGNWSKVWGQIKSSIIPPVSSAKNYVAIAKPDIDVFNLSGYTVTQSDLHEYQL